jgi:two-component system chemotaxis sensor kinase CheA
VDNIVNEFLVESYENLDRLDRDLVELEKAPTDKEILSSIFRTIHTIKGTCGFLGFTKLESVAHVGENLLSRLRDGELTLSPALTTALLHMIDAVRQILTQIEQRNEEGDADYSELIETLTRLTQEESTIPTAAASAEDGLENEVTPEAELGSRDLTSLGEAVGGGAESAPVEMRAAPLAPAIAQPENMDARPNHPDAKQGNVAEGNIRVDVGLLDKLMDLVGELVLARNQILQFTATQQEASFVQASQRLNLITTELQEGVMKTRMQPIGNVWNKFPRVVRDLALACGKQIRVEMEGKETELDKTIIEAIKDPLTHIVRNSADHGIETPQKRVLAGKSAEGRVSLRAYHEGGQVNIEISDDGSGIDPARLKDKAIQRGLISRDDAARMNDREALNLIFLPGFSTAEKITNVSGRGVGMDVVKTNIEKIGGTVDIQSRVGQGSTLKIKIPLTLAIIPALIITSGGDRYAIPQVSLLELVRLEGEQARAGIEMIHGAPVYRLRGNLLPLVDLNSELRVEARAAHAKGINEEINIVVLQADERQFGLVVDGINDTEEIVVKPLSKQLKGLPLFAGATIMGDGHVALILDVMGIAQHASVVSEVRDRGLSDKNAHAQVGGQERQTLLLCRPRQDGQLAIPLASVARLEEFRRDSVELAGHQEVVQYRGQIMPLVRLPAILYPGESEPNAGADTMQVVVYSHGGKSVGLVVGQIVDIVDEAIAVERKGEEAGIQGSAVIQQRVTDLLDIQGLLSMAGVGLVGVERRD